VAAPLVRHTPSNTNGSMSHAGAHDGDFKRF
jgi:hypothetical protein